MEESELRLRGKITKCANEGFSIGETLGVCRDSSHSALLMLIREIYYGEPSEEAMQGTIYLNQL